MDCNTIYCSNATTTDTTVVLIPNRDIKTLEDINKEINEK